MGGGGWDIEVWATGMSRLQPGERRLSAAFFCALSKLLALLPLVLSDGSKVLLL